MEKIWKELSSNLKENPKATLVQTQEAGRGLVAVCDLQRHRQINYRTGTSQKFSSFEDFTRSKELSD